MSAETGESSDIPEESDLLLSSEELEEENAVSLQPTAPAISWRMKLAIACAPIRKSWLMQELVVIVKLSFPIMLTLVTWQSLFLISLLFVGHITGESLELDAAGLASSFASVTGVSVGIGIASAADTLSSQAYGFGNYKRVGVILQRGILILAISMFPVFVLWVNSEPILLLLQQDPCVARLTSQFLLIICLALPSMFLYALLQRYLETQGIVWVFVLVGLLTNVISIGANAILIFAANLGIMGAAIAMVLAFTSSPVILIVYMCARGLHKQTWGGWSWESLSEWGQYVKFGVPGLLMVCCEWWSFEITAIVAGSIDETQLGINSIIMNLTSMIFTLPYGLGIGASIRVGNALGAGNPLRAKRAAYTALGLISVCSVVTSVVLLAGRSEIGALFTNDKEVIDGVAKAIYAMAPLVICDMLQGTIAGVLRGCGRQTLGAVINFLSYYVVGLPVGISLALVADMGTLGLWTGLLIGDFLQTVAYVIVVFTTQWEYQSQRAIKNAQDSNTQVTSVTGEYKNVCVPSEGVAEDSTSHYASQDEEKELKMDRETEEDEIPLVSFEDGEQQMTVSEVKNGLMSPKSKSRMKLLLYRSSFFLMGITLLVVGSVAGHYIPQPEQNYSECTDADIANSSAAFISPTMTTMLVTVEHTIMPTLPVPSP